MDVSRSHVVLIAGKRGSGKSYTMGVLTEEMSDLEPQVAENIASLIFDTMGIFWTMKFKNDKVKKSSLQTDGSGSGVVFGSTRRLKKTANR